MPEAEVEDLLRRLAPQVLGAVVRRYGHFDSAEDATQEALIAAAAQWPDGGIPDHPRGWLITVASRRLTDLLRAEQARQRREDTVARWVLPEQGLAPGADAAPGDRDDTLILLFMCCHPALTPASQIALTLRAVGGLATAEIARAFLVPEPTIAQRIVRAKRALAEANVPFEVPRGPELGARLASVLEVIYLVFNEGYAATAGDDWMRPGLCEDALRLGRVLAELAPGEPEVHGLVALMELQASRTAARSGSGGAPILLLDQNRALWNQLLIGRGLAALARAEALGGADGPYVLQAAIAACHARARTADATDWPRIAALYARLAAVVRSPVVELNRAVAVGMAEGPAAGLALVDALCAEPSLASYHLLPSVRADLLAKLGRRAEARRELERAASLTRNAREREMLLARAAELA